MPIDSKRTPELNAFVVTGWTDYPEPDSASTAYIKRELRAVDTRIKAAPMESWNRFGLVTIPGLVVSLFPFKNNSAYDSITTAAGIVAAAYVLDPFFDSILCINRRRVLVRELKNRKGDV